MDKDNNKNIDDILKLLKNTVESTETPSDVQESESLTENMNTEALKEKLREQFMNESEVAVEQEDDEYAIDEEFMFEAQSVVEDELIPEPKSEDELLFDEGVSEVEVVDDASEEYKPLESEEQTSEIVDIVIPFVDVMRNERKETEEDSDAPEQDVSYDDEEIGGFVMFNDAPEAEDEEEDEFSFVIEEEDSFDEFVSEEESETEEQIPQNNTIVSENSDDDLPWYDETPSWQGKNGDIIFVEKAVEVQEDIFSDDEQGYEMPEPEETQKPYAIELLDDEHELVIEDVKEEEPVEEEQHVEIVAEENTEVEINVSQVTEQEEKFDIYAVPDYTTPEEEEQSFYRTILRAKGIDLDAEEEHTFVEENYPLEASEEEDESKGEVLESDDEIEIPQFEGSLYRENEQIAEGNVNEKTKDARDMSADFYGTGDREVDYDEDRIHDQEDDLPEQDIEYGLENDDTDEAVEKSSPWKKVKPILLGVLSLFIFILELLPILELVPDGMFDYTAYPFTYILIDAQLLIFMAAICYEKIFVGIKKLLSASLDLYSIISLSIIMTVLHSIIACFCANEIMPYLYNSVSAICLLTLSIFELLDEKRIKNSIYELSEKSVYTLRRSHGKNSCAEKMYMGGVDPDTNIYEPAEISGGGFRESFAKEKDRFDDLSVIYAIMPIAVFSIVMAVISTVIEQDFVIALNTAISIFLSALPLSAIISHFLPTYIAYRRLEKRGCFISGYISAREIGECDALVFSDSHLFRASNSKDTGIKIYNERRTRDLFVCLDAVYSAIGGPMEKVFSGGAPSIERHRVNMIRITRSGIEAVIDGRTNIIVGSSSYLGRYGIMTDGADAKDKKGGILYVALDSVLCAKLSASYKTQPLFEALSTYLGDNGIRTIIQTYDPLISGRYVAKCRKRFEYPISVVHKNILDYNAPGKSKTSAARTGIFAISSRLKLVELVVFCKRLNLITRINIAIRIAFYALLALLGIILTVNGAIENINMFWVLLYHGLAAAIYAFSVQKCLPKTFDEIMASQNSNNTERNKNE